MSSDMQGTMTEVSYCWRVMKFSTPPSKFHSYRSSEYQFNPVSFTSLDGKNSGFSIQVCQSSQNSTDFISIYILFSSDVTASAEVSLLDTKGVKHFTSCMSNQLFRKLVRSGWEWFVERDSLEKNPDLLPNDTLTIMCTVRQGDPVQSRDITNPIWLYPRLLELSNNLKTLYLSEDHHDVRIQVGDKDYPAHKYILSARSPVFKAMLSHEMKENKENKIALSDLSDDVVRGILEFIYTGECPKLDELPEELIVAADKYGLESLKLMCAASLSKNLTAENACRRYLLGDLYNLKTLLSIIEEFALTNMPSIIRSPTFDELAANPEVLKKFLLSQHSTRLTLDFQIVDLP